MHISLQDSSLSIFTSLSGVIIGSIISLFVPSLSWKFICFVGIAAMIIGFVIRNHNQTNHNRAVS